jgi:hypothetical protein
MLIPAPAGMTLLYPKLPWQLGGETMLRTTMVMVLVICSIAYAPFVFADAGGNWIVHENPSAGESYSEQSTIKMTAEYVDIVLNPESVQVNAVFEFENTGPECSVGMVFPLDGALQPVGGWDELYGKYPNIDWYHGFKNVNGVWYDNDIFIKPEEVKTDFQVTVDNSAPLDYSLIKLAPNGVSAINGYAEWHLAFDSGQRRVVSCHYTSDYGGWGEMDDRDFQYILDTGSSWKDTIGYGRITVKPGQDFADMWRKRFLLYDNPGLPPAQDLGDQIVWEFGNLEPDADCGICVYIFRDSTAGLAYTYYNPGGKGPGNPGNITAPNGINFRTEPDSKSSLVPGKETLAKGEEIAALERNGDWYYVRTNGDYYGWVRWRYVDPDSGEEYRYIHLMMRNE